jgi:spore germination protein GerM
MGRKRIIIIFSVLVLIAAGAAYMLAAYISGGPPFSGLSGKKAGSAEVNYPEKAQVNLYFADNENVYLRSEQRSVPRPPDPAEFGRVIIESLIKGPRGELVRTIPEEASLKAFYIAKDGASYADFTPAIREKHPGGSSSELMTIYSIVNSLVMNIPEIRTVKILIDGQESMTLAGHIDLRFPFKVNTALAR